MKNIPFIKTRDIHGKSVRRYKRICKECHSEEWVGSQTITKKRTVCRKCRFKNWKVSKETREKISRTLRKKYTSPSYKEMVMKAQFRLSGKKHWNWKGGISPVNQKERKSETYKVWRLAVFRRDLYHCRICKENTALVAHHIICWSIDNEKRYDLDNGITLCENCHEIIHLYLKEINKQYAET